MRRRVIRAVAIAIALAGAIDPAITSTRSTKPEVAVVPADSGDAALATDVGEALGGPFTVISAPYPGASATVIVGKSLPRSASHLTSPVFAVIPDRSGPSVTLENAHSPPSSPLDARIPIAVALRVTGARGRSLDVTLRMNDLVVDRVAHTVADDDAWIEIPLAFVPTDTGVAPVRVAAVVAGGRDTASADLAIDIRDDRWSVLFFDLRPSWMSTFVRREIERDPRFTVTSRSVTSRNVSTDAGRPPPGLADGRALAPFDAVVVGAPDALTSTDVGGLDAYLRRRGGSVVLLLDQRAGGAYARWIGVGAWERLNAGAGLVVAGSAGDSAGLRASEVIWPRVLPAGARPVASSRLSPDEPVARRPVIWRSAVGAGRVIVSGALDAWRFRDPSVSGFDRFWRTLIADAAAAAPRAIEVEVAPPVLRPGERASVRATVRDIALAPLPAAGPLGASIAATLETPGGSEPVRLWPEATIGRFAGSVRVPGAAGTYRLVVATGGSRAEVPIPVATGTYRPMPDDRDLVRAWVGSRGGAAIPVGRLGELRGLLDRAVAPEARRETWYPMRSPWWLLPFTLALGLEWLWRRRRGLR